MPTTHIGILEDHPMIQQYLTERVKEIIPAKTYWDNSPITAQIQLDFVVDTFDKFKARLRREDSRTLDILLLDLSFDITDRFDGKDVALYCAKYYPQLKIIVVSDFLKDEKEALLKIPNVKRCLSKTDIFNKKKLLGNTIIEVADIEAKVSTRTIKKFIEEKATKTDVPKSEYDIEVIDNVKGFELTPSKKPILEFLAKGRTSKQIAAADCLNKKFQTIDKHISELREQFGTTTNEALITKALFVGVLRFR
jgi:DNA-binding NarL/FixJ family response regulator